MMYAASLPQIAILLATVQAFENGELEETPEILKDATHMIRYSSDEAATRMINRLGFESIQAVLTDPRYELYDPRRGGGLWIGEPYAKQGERRPDPVWGLLHGATATQVCQFYYLLATGRLINSKRCAQMLEILSAPSVPDKFVHSLASRAPQAELYRKSGAWKNWRLDSVLVWEKRRRRYILAALVESEHGEQILRELVPAVEEELKPSP